LKYDYPELWLVVPWQSALGVTVSAPKLSLGSKAGEAQESNYSQAPCAPRGGKDPKSRKQRAGARGHRPTARRGSLPALGGSGGRPGRCPPAGHRWMQGHSGKSSSEKDSDQGQHPVPLPRQRGGDTPSGARGAGPRLGRAGLTEGERMRAVSGNRGAGNQTPTASAAWRVRMKVAFLVAP
jgi:hypothetical protein